MDSFEQTVERYRAALKGFVKGDPDPALRLFSQRDDVVLCNPLGPPARGPSAVADALRGAASHFAEGEYTAERLATFATDELGYTVEIERFKAKIDGKDGSGALRVTMIYRLEDDGWRVAHRHADPITTPQATESILQK